jgi:hypothetical protein
MSNLGRKKTEEVRRQAPPHVLDVRPTAVAAPEVKKRKVRRRVLRWIWWVVVGAVVVGGGIVAAVVWWPRPELPKEGEAAAKVVKARVARHYLLPTDEEPALATITDKSKLSSPAFKQAEDGDRLLIYQKNRMAIVYRPSIDRVVAIVPVSIDEPTNITKQQGGGK